MKKVLAILILVLLGIGFMCLMALSFGHGLNWISILYALVLVTLVSGITILFMWALDQIL